MGRVPNRFFRKDDKHMYKDLNLRFEHIYKDIMKSGPHKGNGTKDTVIHWSREVEYSWVIENSGFLKGMSVVDLGCGGSPMPYFMYHDKGCDVYAVDQYLYPNERNSLWGYTEDPSKKFPEIVWIQGKMEKSGLSNLDRIVCVSVFEHMKKGERVAALSNISRMLTDDGLFVMTMDVDDQSPLVFVSKFIADASSNGLRICGGVDFSVPPKDDMLGIYHVCGIVFGKI